MSAYAAPASNYPHPSLHGVGVAGSPNDQQQQQQPHDLNLPRDYTYDAQAQLAQLQQQAPPPPPPSYGSNGAQQNGHPGELKLEFVGPMDPTTGASAADGQKGNRLRKACDSCSVRKVKVCRVFQGKKQTLSDNG